MTERGADILPTTSLGHYKVRAKIGSGGMGDVFDAIHTGLNKRVAIKTLRKRFLDDDVVVQRFLREGQLASRIRHPNIVDVTDVGMMGGLPCLVMEHLEGESLSAMIRREGRLSIETIADLLLPIIAAVDFAHEHGVVHRDLKPSNIFLSRSWNGEIVPKVLDFGISKLVHDSQQAALTTDSAFVGTPHYASPELMRADKLADGRSDQYSMGVILYECATGIRPFADLGNNFIALAMAICKGEYPPARLRNPSIPPGFDLALQRAMSLAAQDRFLTMRGLGEALLPFANQRARMIWAPTFSQNGQAAQPAAEMQQVGPVSVATVASKPSFAPGTPVGMMAPMSQTGAVPSGPRTPISHHGSAPTGPVYQAYYPGDPAVYPSGTPGGAAFDRLPSYGTGAVVPPAMQSRSSTMITVIVGMILGLALLVTVIVVRGHKRPEEPTAVAATAKASDTFVLDLTVVTPPTAVIELDGVVAGTGRVTKQLPRNGSTHALRVSATGYESFFVQFTDTNPPPASIVLRALPPASPQGIGTHKPPPPSPAPPAGPAPVSGGGKQRGSSDGRPKTDNIDPWE